MVLKAIDEDISKVKIIHRFKARQVNTRPASVLVQLTEESVRNVFMQSAKKLRNISRFKNVYINAHLTEKEKIQ